MFLSCYLPGANNFSQQVLETNKSTPFLMCHGEDDSVVQFEWGKKSFDMLVSLGMTNGKFVNYEDMGHSASYDEIRDCLEFIQKAFGLPVSPVSNL